MESCWIFLNHHITHLLTPRLLYVIFSYRVTHFEQISSPIFCFLGNVWFQRRVHRTSAVSLIWDVRSRIGWFVNQYEDSKWYSLSQYIMYVHTFKTKKKKKKGKFLISSHSHTNNDVTPNLILKTEIGRGHGIVLYIQNVYNCLFVDEIPFLQASCLHSSYTMNTKSFALTCSHFPAEKTMRQGF